MSRFVRTVLTIVILVLSGILSGWLVLNLTFKGGEVVVPEITGKDIIFTLEVLSERDLNLKVSGWQYSNSIPKNYVISQKPLPGQSLKKDGDVNVIMSKGTKEVAIPRLVGEIKRKAEIILKRNGLKVGNVTRVHSSRYKKDVVIGQDPLPQTKAGRGTKVNLMISKGRTGDAYFMPDLTGRDIKEVVKVIENMKLGVGNVSEELREDMKPGLVLGHEPGYGYKISADEKVDFVVSKHPGPDKSIEGTYQMLYYKTPEELASVRVRIVLEDESGVKQVYNQKQTGGTNIRLLIKTGKNTKAKIYLNNTLVEERVY